jgi:hypothetical protein
VLEARGGELIEALEQATVEGLERVGVDLAVDRQDDHEVHRHGEDVELQGHGGALAVLDDDEVGVVAAHAGRCGADEHGRQGRGGGRDEDRRDRCEPSETHPGQLIRIAAGWST